MTLGLGAGRGVFAELVEGGSFDLGWQQDGTLVLEVGKGGRAAWRAAGGPELNEEAAAGRALELGVRGGVTAT